jgi:hypothetical protein
MKSDEELQKLMEAAQLGLRLKITPLRSDEEDPSAILTEYLDEEKPDFVFLGAFAAMNLRPVAQNHPETLFCALDAPREGIPSQTPFAWAFFDAEPRMPELGAKIRAFLESSSPRPAAAAFLEPAMDEIFSTHPIFNGLWIERVRVSGDDTSENVRGQVGEVLSLKPVLYILSAGIHTSLIFDLIRQQGSPARIVLDDRDGIPAAEGFPVLASMERSYVRAIRTALLAEAVPGDILRISVEIR